MHDWRVHPKPLGQGQRLSGLLVGAGHPVSSRIRPALGDLPGTTGRKPGEFGVHQACKARFVGAKVARRHLTGGQHHQLPILGRDQDAAVTETVQDEPSPRR